SLDFHKYSEIPSSNPLLSTYTGHSNVVREICFLGPYAITCDGSLRLWDVGTNETLRHVHTKSPISMIQSWPDSRLVIGISRNNSIFIDDIRTKVHPMYFSTGLSNTTSLRTTAIDFSRGLLAVGSITGFISVLDLRTGALISSWKASDTDICHLQFKKDSLFSSSSGSSAIISVWDASIFSHIKSIKVNKLSSIDFLEESKQNELLAMDQSGQLAFVSLSSSQVEASIKLSAKKNGSWRFFRNYWDGAERFLFAATHDGNIHCYF
ncbi:WD repeat-containing protein 81, partial [Coelomomyces lativittatus]